MFAPLFCHPDSHAPVGRCPRLPFSSNPARLRLHSFAACRFERRASPLPLAEKGGPNPLNFRSRRFFLAVAAIVAIDPTLYEAASIDGASRFQQVTRITVPAVVPTIKIVTLLGVMGMLRNFDQVFVMANSSIHQIPVFAKCFFQKILSFFKNLRAAALYTAAFP